MANFKSELKNWLCKNGFDVKIAFADDSSYDIDIITINVSTKSYPEADQYFEQYLYEYGLEYTGIYNTVLEFLHELGHHMTVHSFAKEEIVFCQVLKSIIDTDNDQEWFNEYWSIPDEFSANMWAINFINTHIEAVEDLCNIYLKYW